MKKITRNLIKWIKSYFDGTNCNAVIGISGGKDSTVVAALCVKALGRKRVIGVMMPNGVQKDLDDSKEICKFLGIRGVIADISGAYNSLSRVIYNADDKMPELSEQTKINLAPRLRMTTLYGFAQTLNGRVSCNGNMDERLMGYTTLWGDCVGDFAPLSNLHVSQVIEIGDDLGIPEKFVHKIPSDGLTDLSDEETMGFTYADVESMWHKQVNKMDVWTADKTEHDKIFAENEFTPAEQHAYDRMCTYMWKHDILVNIANAIPSFYPDAD